MRRPTALPLVLALPLAALPAAALFAQEEGEPKPAKPAPADPAQPEGEPEPAKPDDAAEPAAGEGELATEKQRYSYAIGQNIGNSVSQQGVDLDIEAFVRGLRDAIAGESDMTPQQIQETLQELERQMQAQAKERHEAQAQANLEEGRKFLEANKEREGVQVTESGLQYEVLEAGQGSQPKPADQVTVHYRGTLIDGTEFDSSYSRGQPATFPVTRVIKGWVEALQMMKVGAKWKLYIPSELAYGANPRPGGPIGPNDVLIFEVELLEIEEGKGAPGGR